MRNDSHDSIHRSIGRLQRRSTAVRFIREEAKFLFFAFAAAAVVTAAWIGIGWLRGGDGVLQAPVAILAGCAFALATIAAVVVTAIRRPGPLDVAKAWDDHIGAKDRLSSALDLGAKPGDPRAMTSILLEDAIDESRRVEPARAYPVRLPRVGWWIPLPVAALLLVSVLPGWLRAAPATNPHLTHTLASQVSQIKSYVAKEKGKELTQQRKEMLERLERLASDLTRDKVQKKDALAELAKLMEQMRKDKNEEDLKKKELEKLLKSVQANDKNKDLTDELNKGNYDDAANKIQELIDKLNDEIKKKREEKASPEEMKKLEERLKELENIKANLMKLRLSKYNINNMTEVLDFLEGFEGELGDLPEEEVVDGES